MIELLCTSINITPDFPVYLSGFENRTIKSENVDLELEINLCIFSFSLELVVMVSVDLLFITEELNNYFYKQIKIQFPDLNYNNLIVCATHTHYAPSIEKRERLGVYDHKYFIYLKSKIDQLCFNLNKIPFFKPIIKITNENLININCNRRRKLFALKRFKRIAVMEPNPKCIVDNEFILINFYDIDGLVRFSIVKFACHPTNFPEINTITAEYPGEIRKIIRESKNIDYPILFLQGFSGDIRAMPPKRTIFKRFIYNLLSKSYPVSFYKYDIFDYKDWIFVMKKNILSVIQHESLFTSRMLSIKNERLVLKDIGINTKHAEYLNFSSIKIDNLLFIFISAEVFNFYDSYIKTMFPEYKIITVGYYGNVFGYLPNKDELKYLGYEVEDFKLFFDIRGKFTSDLENIIKQKICQLIKK